MGSTSTAAKLTASGGAAGDAFGWSVSINGGGAKVVVGANQSASGGNGVAYVFTEPTSGGWLTTSTAAKLTASDGGPGDDFGCSVSINATGNTVVVGADQSASGGNGAAYVFAEPGGGWGNTSTAKELTASGGATGDDFGCSVSINATGDTVVVGAVHSDSDGNGAAYVFTESGSAWSQTNLTASGGVTGDGFGYSVSISGATVVVGAPYATVGGNANQGTAGVFTESAPAWPQTATLSAFGGAAYEEFGYSVAISGATVVVGAPYATVDGNASQGAAYVFTEPGSGGWVSTSTATELIVSGGAAGDDFGSSVAISGDGATVVVGADQSDSDGNGAAYVFTTSGSGWSQTATLTAFDGGPGDDFGASVSINATGATVVVGANRSASGGQGVAYVFTEPSPGGWANSNAAAELTASDGGPGDDFGTSVSINGTGDTVAVGANQSASGGNGAAYVFTEPSPGGWVTTSTAAELTAFDGNLGDDFGASVSINGTGDTVVVGADQSDSDGNGAAYVFTKPGSGGWLSTSTAAELTASGGAAGDDFGDSVSINGTGATVVVGANQSASSSNGAAYVFTKPGSGGWVSTNTPTTLVASDGAVGDDFGASISINGTGDTVVIGANQFDSGGNGAAYVFAIPAPPAVTGISPTAGPLAGSTTVTITGTGFTGATAVDFGATAATNVVVKSATQITATSPAGTGVVDVTVVTPGGTSPANIPGDQFSYVAAPTVTGISPASGPLAGSTSVTIMGTGFTGATAVDFGATAATNVVVKSATQITATSPAGTGVVDVTVVTPGGTSPANIPADQFSYVAAPTVTGISPASGPLAGSTSVTITGTGFTGATAVNFGTTAATNVVVKSATQITATSPAGTGVVDVTVVTPGGTSPANIPADQFSYVAAPTVTGISPASRSVGGRHFGDDHGDGLYGRHGGEFRRDGGNQCGGQIGDADHGHEPGGDGRGGRDGGYAGRHIAGEHPGRSVQLRGCADGDGHQSHGGAFGGRHFGDDHGHGLYGCHGGGFRRDGGNQCGSQHRRRRSRPRARRAVRASWT